MADLTARAAVEYLKRCHTPTYDLQLTTYDLQQKHEQGQDSDPGEKADAEVCGTGRVIH